jgi:hypothetical protein
MTATAISAVVPPRRTTLAGRIVAVTPHVRPWVRTDVVLRDASGSISLRFTGRRGVPGMRPGQWLSVEGTPMQIDDALIMLNPLYSFGPDLMQARDCSNDRL